MRRINEARDLEALDLLADLMEPAQEIFSDAAVQAAYDGGNMLNMARVIIKGHKTAVFAVLAAMEGVPVAEYHCSPYTLPMRVLEVLNDEELQAFFTELGQMMRSGASSGGPTANTQGRETD